MNFLKYRSVGPGGLPNYFVGWIVAMCLKPFGRETTSTLEYQLEGNEATWLQDGLPKRKGDRPTKSWHFAPHRQTDQIPSKDVKAKMIREFHAIQEANASLVVMRISVLEKFGDALQVHPLINPTPSKPVEVMKREVAHVHSWKDCSFHVVLSPADCKIVIDQGWGERHPLSGRGRLFPIPKEYLLIYAPRTKEEVQVVGKIIRAAVGFGSGSREVH
ncbi:hypothetical protein SCHPADRAFT_916673 [Schizopora paradoxa]|uniref:Luciferase domain-containing protein n=1 Tax=Schizopora paradoxa TaxID=27342 RepID=A0A0H2RXE5_9AGAM|nr:hypothetical protein SCHPADRAFT_916673 [Schizopora paradoxa]